MNIQATVTDADQTLVNFIETLSAINPTDYNKVPFDNSWTAGELAQHIILSAGGFNQLLNGADKDTYRDAEENIPNLKSIFLNFDIKMKSPDFVTPQIKEYDQKQQIDALKNIKADFLKAIQTKDITKTCTDFELPNLGYITRAEAITFTIVHTQRHTHQLKNIIKHLVN